MQLGFSLFTQQMARRMPDYPAPRPGNGGPDDTSDPDFPERPGSGGGPDDTTDPDFGGGRDSGGYSGPDGHYGGYDEYH